jgi:threonine aldolase
MADLQRVALRHHLQHDHQIIHKPDQVQVVLHDTVAAEVVQEAAEVLVVAAAQEVVAVHAVEAEVGDNFSITN